MNLDIVYIVSHGFAARMVTQTNLLGLLVENGKSVGLICPDKNDSNLKSYCDKHNITLIEFNPISQFWTSQYAEMRKYFLEDIDNNVALKEKHIYALRKSSISKPFSFIKPRLYYLIYKLIKVFPFFRSWYKKREEKHLQSSEATQLIEAIKPKVLVSTYPVSFIEAMLLKVGNEKSDVKTIIHLLSWDNITCKGHFPQLADEYIAWGPIMRDEFIEYYNIDPKKIHMCGVPHFDVHFDTMKSPDFKKYINELGLDANKPYLFFGMSSPRFAPHEIDIVEWLAKNIEDKIFGENMQLVIRPHPQNVSGGMADLTWIPRLQKLQTQNVAIDFPNVSKSNLQWSMQNDDMIKMSNILYGASVTINSGSTLSIDALSLDRPIVLSSFDADFKLEYWASARRLIDFPHLKKLIYFKGVDIAQNFNELKIIISKYISDINYNSHSRKHSLNNAIKERSSLTHTNEVVQFFQCQM